MALRRPRCGDRSGLSPARAVASCVSCLLEPYVNALGRGGAAGGLAAAMHAASREITIMLAPALGPASASAKAA